MRLNRLDNWIRLEQLGDERTVVGGGENATERVEFGDELISAWNYCWKREIENILCIFAMPYLDFE